MDVLTGCVHARMIDDSVRLPPLHSQILRTSCTEQVPVNGAALGGGKKNLSSNITVWYARAGNILCLFRLQERIGVLAVHNLVVVPSLHKVQRHITRCLALCVHISCEEWNELQKSNY